MLKPIDSVTQRVIATSLCLKSYTAVDRRSWQSRSAGIPAILLHINFKMTPITELSLKLDDITS